ncbi:hypothetical protein BGW36DRAFT_401032 [Talaromyces proteolyticus]|uniref:FAD-binding PCMH-type domain-containing protein n=1 Tax=Talaromyces proteolyticus TaxID=1131652 RepID=A0AAD4KHN4_9EURO|nr:uncharacterized protein BGW36DRAFT_401032 [Talaromyces proteolyticus]KAH8690619.1 hypothetical protein BGW36DRAFT_401032 [Talaromyces proteolyticus]
MLVLKSLFIEDWDERNEATIEDSDREALNLLKEEDGTTYNEVLARYSPDQQELLNEFVGDVSVTSVADKIHPDINTAIGYQQNEILKDAEQTALLKTVPVPGDKRTYKEVKFPVTNDPEGQWPVLTYSNVTFTNWGETVRNFPLYTCIPTTVYGVQGIVKYAKANGYSVRVSGYRHSWSPIFGRDRGENKKFILISTLRLDRAVLGRKPNWEALGAYKGRKTELNKIEAITDDSSGLPPNQQLVRVGCSTTNEDLRRWCLSAKSRWKWTLPLNVIMVEITCGGSNGPICHGAGIQTKTLSDLVFAVEYVDAMGNVQTISRKDGNILSAASGCFGLLGVVTRLTLILDEMSVAFMEPMKLPVIEAIPPPPDVIGNLPPSLKKAYDKYKPEQVQQFVKDFERRALDEYYAEWFWFPFHKQIWVNTWSTKQADPDDVRDYPSEKEISRQIIQNFTLEVMQEVLRRLRKWWPTWSTKQICVQSFQTDTTSILTWLPDALHFRRGIQNARVRDLEVEIPLPTRDNLDIVRKAWWQVITLAYRPENIAICPMRMPLEMRIMGDSNVLMAPQRGNTNGTCAIEVLTPWFMEDEWPRFAQAVLDEWMILRQWNNQTLNIRPHWAKEWVNFQVDNKPWLQYLKETSYRTEIPEFRALLERIGQQQGWTLDEMRAMFSNQVLDELFFT